MRVIYLNNDKHIEEINFDTAPTINMPEQHQVKIKFPTDPVKLANVMDWLWNGTFATFHMDDDLINAGKLAGVEITKVD
jgi:hypothetical protein